MFVFVQAKLCHTIQTLFYICSYSWFLPVLLDPFLINCDDCYVAKLIGCETEIKLHTNVDLSLLYSYTDFTLGSDLAHDLTRVQRIRVEVKIQDDPSEENCSRKINTLFKYHECNLPNFLPILPIFKMLDSYAAHIPTQVSCQGDINYIFTGASAVRFPVKHLFLDWSLEYTILSWLHVKPHVSHQYILSWSGGETSAFNNMGFYVTRYLDEKHAVFSFYQMHQSSGGKNCLVQNKWKLLEVSRWHYLSLSYANCFVELAIDGLVLKPYTEVTDYHLPEKHIQPKFVIGALWVGSVEKYKNFLYGELSGLVMIPGEYAHLQHLKCLLQLKEGIFSPISHAFKESKVWVIEANLTQQSVEILLNNIKYYNFDFHTNYQLKSVDIEIQNLKNGLTVYTHQCIKVERKSEKLEINGNCHSQQRISSNGIVLCEEIHIISNRCDQGGIIDTLVIAADKSLPNIKIPVHLLQKYRLLSTQINHGIQIQGIAPVKHYNHILSMARYLPTNVSEDANLRISIFASSNANLIKSNKFTLNVRTNASKMTAVITVDVGYGSVHQIYDKLPGHSRQYFSFFWFLLVSLTGALVFIISVSLWKGKRLLRKDMFGKINETSSNFFTKNELHLYVHPSERISTTKECFEDDFLRHRLNCNSYSEDSDSSEYCDDNDSIRQLEWESLENSIEDILFESNLNLEKNFFKDKNSIVNRKPLAEENFY